MCPRGKMLPLNTVVHDFTPQIMLKRPGGLEEKGSWWLSLHLPESGVCLCIWVNLPVLCAQAAGDDVSCAVG